MRIGLDAMGGDNAPECTVSGAVMAAEEFGYEVTLIGDEHIIKKELRDIEYPKDKIKTIHATQVIGMDEPAALSVRKKRDASIVKGLEFLKKGAFDAFVSAGNTGAVVCAATLSLRLLPGVDRPGIGIVLPTLGKSTFVIDVGANIDPKPLHFLQYGIMGDAYAKRILGRPNPTIGLLNIGEESSKGTGCIREAHMMLSESKLDFIGNVEPKEVYEGKADVVVCDGFVGNVFLKVTEGFAGGAGELIRRELRKSNFIVKFGVLLALPAFKALKKEIDSSEYGGAPLMGVDGSVIISHGSANDVAIKNSIRAAADAISQKMNTHIVEELQSY